MNTRDIWFIAYWAIVTPIFVFIIWAVSITTGNQIVVFVVEIGMLVAMLAGWKFIEIIYIIGEIQNEFGMNRQ